MVQSKLLLNFTGLKHYFLGKNDISEFEDYKKIVAGSIFAKQIHSNKATFITGRQKNILETDALITNQKLILGVKTADCLPILFFDHYKKMVATLHAGWRGLNSGIIENTIIKMKKYGSHPQNILSVVGPHIRKCCYSVNRDHALMFKKKFSQIDKVVQVNRSKWYLDLTKIALFLLRESGIVRANIDILSECTYCNHKFYSYRREGLSSGRNYSVIGIA